MNDSAQRGNSTEASFIHQLYSVEFVVICCIIYVLIMIASLLGNITVCVVILSTRSLRRSVNACFILSLSVSDLLTTCLVMPFELEQFISDAKWSHGEIMCNVWTTAYLLAVPTSILSLLALSFYRYRTLKDPLDRFKESPLMTRRRAFLIICILWAYSMLFSLAPVLGWKQFPQSVIDGVCFFNITTPYSFMSSVVNFLLPVLAACLINFRMYYVVLKLSRSSLQHDEHCKESQPNTLSNEPENMEELTKSKPIELSVNLPPTKQKHIELNRPQNENTVRKLQQKRSARAAKTTFLIVFSFVFCWLPFTILSMIGAFCHVCFGTVPPQVFSVLLMMGYLNSAINPILYSFRSLEFKKAVREMMCNKRG